MPKTATLAAAEQGAQAKTSLRERLAGKRPQTAEYTIVLDEQPWRAVQTAEQALKVAELTGSSPEKVAEAQAKADAARQLADGAAEVLHLQGLARGAYEALLLAHPPTEAGKADGASYDIDAFSPALVACCIVDPDGPVRALTATDVETLYSSDTPREFWAGTGRPLLPADVAELWADWNQGEVGALWAQAVQLSTQPRNPSLPFG